MLASRLIAKAKVPIVSFTAKVVHTHTHTHPPTHTHTHTHTHAHTHTVHADTHTHTHTQGGNAEGEQHVCGQGDAAGANGQDLEADLSANTTGGLHHSLLFRFLTHRHEGLETCIKLLKLWLHRRSIPGDLQRECCWALLKNVSDVNNYFLF